MSAYATSVLSTKVMSYESIIFSVGVGGKCLRYEEDSVNPYVSLIVQPPYRPSCTHHCFSFNLEKIHRYRSFKVGTQCSHDKKEWDKNLRLKWRRQLINMYLYRDAPAIRQCEFSSSSFNEVSLRFKIWIIFWCYTRCCCLLLLLTWRGTLLWTIPQRKQGKRWLHNWLRQLECYRTYQWLKMNYSTKQLHYSIKTSNVYV